MVVAKDILVAMVVVMIIKNGLFTMKKLRQQRNEKDKECILTMIPIEQGFKGEIK